MASSSESLQMSGEKRYPRDSCTSDSSPPCTIGCHRPVEQACSWEREMRSQPQRTAPHHQAAADDQVEVEIFLLSPEESEAEGTATAETATALQQNWWDDEPITPCGGPMAEAVLIFDLCD